MSGRTRSHNRAAMAPETILLFLLTDLAFCLTPGPATLVTVAHAAGASAGRGWRAAAGPMAGIHVGNMGWYALTGLGLVALIKAAPVAYQAVKWAGVAYLAVAGVAMWRARRAAVDPAEPRRRGSTFASGFGAGFAVHMANPKALLFYAAIAPPFIDPAHPVWPQVATLAAITLFTEQAGLGVYTWLTLRLGRPGGGAPRWSRRVGGGVLIAVAVILALANIA